MLHNALIYYRDMIFQLRPGLRLRIISYENSYYPFIIHNKKRKKVIVFMFKNFILVKIKYMAEVINKQGSKQSSLSNNKGGAQKGNTQTSQKVNKQRIPSTIDLLRSLKEAY